MRLSIQMFLLVFLSSCNYSSRNEIDYSAEINALTTVQSQIEYLEEIYRLDQKCRTNETEVQTQFGYDSQEHKAAWDIIREVDETNIAKLELYIDKFGHPSKQSHGTTASITPWIIIHHSQGTIHRQRYFPELYKAYRLGDLDDGRFTFYMNRWYDYVHGERLKLQSPFRTETEVDTLIKAMSMQEIRLEIDEALSTIRP